MHLVGRPELEGGTAAEGCRLSTVEADGMVIFGAI